MSFARETVEKLMLRVWGEQACQNTDYWPDVLKCLFSDAKSKDGAPVRSSYRPRFDLAVDTITSALADGVQDANELTMIIWRAFPMLDRKTSCQRLAEALIAAAAPPKKGVFDDL
jgi:hypothetical protein